MLLLMLHLPDFIIECEIVVFVCYPLMSKVPHDSYIR